MRNFKELVIWQKGIIIAKDTYDLTAVLPKDETYGLKTQLQRAAVSISSNIAEGCSRNSERDFKKFLEYAVGSTYELENQLIIAEKVNLLSKEKINNVLQLINEEQKMINSFIKSLKTRIKTERDIKPKHQKPKT